MSIQNRTEPVELYTWFIYTVECSRRVHVLENILERSRGYNELRND